MDREGALLISDPAMPDAGGRVDGAVLRYRPGVGAEYLFQGKPWHLPLGMLPR